MDVVKSIWEGWDLSMSATNKLWNFGLFTRGPVGLMAVLGLMSQIFDFSRFPLVRAIHAVIVSWNEFMVKLGNLIPIKLPIEFDAITMNFIMLCLWIIIPSLLITINSSPKKSVRERSEYRTYIGYVFDKISFTLFLKKPLGYITSPLVFIASSYTFIILPIKNNVFSNNTLSVNIIVFSIMFLFFLVYILFPITLGMATNKHFRTGIISAVLILITIEALYYSPVIGSYLNDFADSKLGPEQ